MFKGIKKLLIDEVPQSPQPQPIIEESIEDQIVGAGPVEETPIIEEAPPVEESPTPEMQLLSFNKTIRYRELMGEIHKQWAYCKIDPMAILEVKNICNKILAYKYKYDLIEKKIGVPWYLTGVIHYRESSFSLTHNLCNGESLDVVTTNVPKGRGPYHSWEESAIDAFNLQSLHLIPVWSIERVLFECERFNGFGYRLNNHVSPYVWAYSNHNSGRGVYTKDHHYDPQAESKQIGCGVILNQLTTLGAMSPSYEGR